MANVNYVLEGKYKGRKIKNYSILRIDKAEINGTDYPLSHYTVSSYTVIDENNKDKYSFWKGALGMALFGEIGAVAGIGGKNKKEYLVSIEWKDGGKSLILINDDYYKVLVKSMF